MRVRLKSRASVGKCSYEDVRKCNRGDWNQQSNRKSVAHPHYFDSILWHPRLHCPVLSYPFALTPSGQNRCPIASYTFSVTKRSICFTVLDGTVCSVSCQPSRLRIFAAVRERVRHPRISEFLFFLRVRSKSIEFVPHAIFIQCNANILERNSRTRKAVQHF